jgi:Ca2+/Na+ antiporter
MKKYMKEYIEGIDKLIESKKVENIDKVIEEHLLKIGFFQHERLIHFLVTILFTLLTFATFLYTLNNVSLGFVLLTIALLCLEVPYIFHYYFLENSVQHMYDQHDELIKIRDKKNK